MYISTILFFVWRERYPARRLLTMPYHHLYKMLRNIKYLRKTSTFSSRGIPKKEGLIKFGEIKFCSNTKKKTTEEKRLNYD